MLAQVLVVAVLALVLIGVTTPFWAVVGAGRALLKRWTDEPTAAGFRLDPVSVPDRRRVAVLIAAHNEAMVLPTTLRSAVRQVAPDQVFVASDGSSDGTADVARGFGANVLELDPNRGKAGALAAAIDHFALTTRFEVVLLLDADTVLADDYLDTGLPLFAGADVVAVAGTAATSRDPGPSTRVGRVLVGYRERVYVVVQYLQKFGQASRAANAVSIVPGFASMYRTRVLDRIEITAPGLTIEDFNMTFEIHAKRLGRIAFRPGSATAYTQDPDSLHDYVRQVGRWSLGFWQTVGRHRPRRDAFWAALSVYIAELVVGNLAFVLMPPAVVLTSAAFLSAELGLDPTGVGGTIAVMLPAPILLAGALLPDYLLTAAAAVIARRPSFLAFGLVFPLVRLVDASVSLLRLVAVVRSDSDGVWTSPTRRPTSLAAGSADG